MSDTPVTICIPSNRDLAGSQRSLDSAITYAAQRGFRVSIADNSGDKAKAAYYASTAPHVRYLISDSEDAASNMVVAHRDVTTEFVMPMGDDDFLVSEGSVPVFDFSQLPADFVGVRPTHDIIARDEGVLRSFDYSIDGDKPSARVQEYASKMSGNNTLYYSFFRRHHFDEILVLYLQNHPTRLRDGDIALVNSLTAAGRIAHDGSTRYGYDIGRWRTRAGINEAVLEFYQDAGFPDSAVEFASLLHFVDSYILLFRPGFPGDEVERIKTIYAYAISFVGPFLQKVQAKPELIVGIEPLVEELRQATSTPDEHLENVFDAALKIVDPLKPGLRLAYAQWLSTMLSSPGVTEAG